MSDIGIISYGVRIPKYRLSRKTIFEAMGWLNPGSLPGEKAVANYDEDSLSLAVGAAIACLNGLPRSQVAGVYLATTTAPYRERQSATIMADALDLRPDIRTADFTDSLRSGTTALLAACDAARGEGASNILLCATDCRLARPGSSQDMLFGDGAAALMVGNQGVIATLEGHYSLSYDFPDYRRAEYDRFVRAVEDRFIREQGYTKFVPEIISGLLKKYNLETKDIAKVAFPSINLRDPGAIAKKLGLGPEQLQEPLLAAIGETGAASPIILLAAMLDTAKPGDNIVIAGYGNGAEALLLKVTNEIEKVKGRGSLQSQFASDRKLDKYEKYLAFNGILPVQVDVDSVVANTQLPLAWRERKGILALYGSRCRRCGTPQYPAQRVCVNPNCGATDEMEEYCFADKKGTLFSFTADHTSANINPPLLYGMIDFEEGGRYVFELTDCDYDSLKVGMPVEMSFRKKYLDESRGLVGYFWKAVPTTE